MRRQKGHATAAAAAPEISPATGGAQLVYKPSPAMMATSDAHETVR